MVDPAALSVIRLGWPVSNVWLVPQTVIGPVLVDTGYPLLWPFIQRGLRHHGLDPRDIAAVVLTHSHSDHAGNAYRFQAYRDVPIYAHKIDAEVLTRQRPQPRLPAASGITGLFCLVENRRAARACAVTGLQDGDVIAGLEVIAVPGHTPGSVFFYHRASATLFTGDALLNGVPPLTVETRLCLPHRPFCSDYPQALRSLQAFLQRELSVRLLCPGHGPARPGPVDRELRELLAQERAAWRECP